MFRELLASVLMIRSAVKVLGQAGEPTEFRRLCRERPFELLVLAIAADSWADQGVIEEFLASNPQGKIIVIRDSNDPFKAPDGLGEDRMALVDRSESLRNLWTAIDAIDGRRLLSSRNGESTLRSRLGGQALSPRESQIFGLIGEGLTNKQIAEKLNLSDHTVRTHRKRLAAKLGTEGAELTRWAIVSRQNEASSLPPGM